MKRFILIVLCFMVMLPLVAQMPDADKVSYEVRLNPERISPGLEGIIEVTFTLPSHLHANKQEDYLFIETEPFEGIEFFPTTYPKGKLHDGIVSYYGTFTLEKRFRVSADLAPGEISMKSFVGWQVCIE
ncbi:MAG: hypothetical protein K8S56_08145, partial [Candidatus Cloacimonetes bacterium]|nr:hypothetical protein [Candidatus Cloacimonadota bacterium]